MDLTGSNGRTSNVFWNGAQNILGWSSYGASQPLAYNLYVKININLPSAEDSRFYGFPLRCLSTVLGM